MYQVMRNTSDIQSRMLNFLISHREMTGARVIIELIAKPGSRVELMELCRRIYYPRVTPVYIEKLTQHAFTLVPLADKRTIAEYLKRLNILNARKSQGCDSSELDWEINWLTRELRRICRPGKGVKAEAPELRRAYTALRMGVLRLLRKAEATDKELYLYLRSHLKTGYSFMWLRDNVSLSYHIDNTDINLINVA